MASAEYNIDTFFASAVKYWWVLVLGIVAGGLLGWGSAMLRAPVYEASASLLVAIDRHRSSIRDDITIYQADDRIRALLLSDRTLMHAIEKLHDATDETSFQSPTEFREAIKIAQGPASISLYFYSSNPDTAAAAVNAWASASLEDLQQAYLHAVRSAELQGALYEAHCTLQEVGESGDMRALWICTSGDSDLQVEEIPDALLEEVQASRGILPFYSFSLGQSAETPSSPVLWNRSGLIIAGIVAGIVVGLGAIIVLYRGSQGAVRRSGPGQTK